MSSTALRVLGRALSLEAPGIERLLMREGRMLPGDIPGRKLTEWSLRFAMMGFWRFRLDP